MNLPLRCVLSKLTKWDNMIKKFLLAVFVCGPSMIVSGQPSTGKFEPVDFAQVHIGDSFWSPMMDRLRRVTLRACILYTETKTGRIRNFEKAALRKGEHEGKYYDDADVYKALESMGYVLHMGRDSGLERTADEWIDKIAAAQLPDGYINTYYTLTGIDHRWTDMEKHEDFCAGHLIEAGIAYYQATGKRKLLDVGIRMANHMDSTFRLGHRHWVSGHEEIELALVRLYHLTHNASYLKLSQWFLDQRGHGYGKGVIWDDWKNPGYCQDDVPVRAQRKIEGHAVRAMYLYSGAADVASATGDSTYWAALESVWEDVVGRNLYITGGIGAEESNEGFGLPYHLPNREAYCETCASVGMVFWNQRMNRLSGDAKYADVMERSLYNAALDGISLSGDHFFYGNPLASPGNVSRKEWFGTACCPSNISRLLASLGGYIYGASPDAIWVNLFIQDSASIAVGADTVALVQHTRYPWDGSVQITVSPVKEMDFGLHIRIPGWLERPVPGGLYTYTERSYQRPELSINGHIEDYPVTQGYAVIQRKWKKGDKIDLRFPMKVRLIEANPLVKADSGRVSLQYGPLIYCIESVDNGQALQNLAIQPTEHFTVAYEPGLLGGVNVIRFAMLDKGRKGVGVAIPYYSWDNRTQGEMEVWLPDASAVRRPAD